MGFEEFYIVLNSKTGTYTVGQTINGLITFEQKEAVTIHGIYVNFLGYCKVHWNKHENKYDDYEEYINKELYVLGDAAGKQYLHPGHHEYGFSCPIPSDSPPSFEGVYGHIRYHVKVVIVTVAQTVIEKLSVIKVLVPVDLNQNHYCKEPIEIELEKSYSGCFTPDRATIGVKFSRSGYVPGALIPMELHVHNRSSGKIKELSVGILKIETYFSKSGLTQQRATYITREVDGPFKRNEQRCGNTKLYLPEIDVYDMTGCKLIDVQYMIRVTAERSGRKTQAEMVPLILGTIPLCEVPYHEPKPNLAIDNYNQYSPYPGGMQPSAPVLPLPNNYHNPNIYPQLNIYSESNPVLAQPPYNPDVTMTLVAQNGGDSSTAAATAPITSPVTASTLITSPVPASAPNWTELTTATGPAHIVVPPTTLNSHSAI